MRKKPTLLERLRKLADWLETINRIGEALVKAIPIAIAMWAALGSLAGAA